MDPLGIVTLLIKVTIVLAAAWAIAGAMTRASAAARCQVWTTALAFAAALPMLTVVAPAWHLSWLPAGGHSVSEQQPPRVPLTADAVYDLQPDTVDTTVAADWLAIKEPGFAAKAAAFSRNAGIVFTAIWFIGAAVGFCRIGAGLMSLSRLVRTAEPLHEDGWEALVRRSCDDIGVRRPPRVVVSARVDAPAASGMWHHTLVLPATHDIWSLATRRVVVLHELAHMKRRDCLVQFFSECVRAIYWFHPLVRMTAARLRDERERACDNVVLTAGTPATEYADQLIDLVHSAVSPASVGFAARSNLESRIRGILDEHQCRTTPGTFQLLAGVAAATLAVVVIGGVTVAAQPASNAPTTVRMHVDPVARREVSPGTKSRVADAFVVALWDADDQVRSVAARALETIQTDVNVPTIVEVPCRANCFNMFDVLHATHSFDDTKQQALEHLMHAARELRQRSAEAGLESEDVEVRRQAVKTLWGTTPHGAVALATALLDPDREVRVTAAIRLDSVHAAVAVPNWIVLLTDHDPMLRERAAISLGVIGDPRAIDPLAGTLRDAEPAVRLQAVKALASIALGEPPTASMR